MNSAVLIDLREDLFTFDPHVRVEAFIRLLADRTQSEEQWSKISKVLLGSDAEALQKKFGLNLVSAGEFKECLQTMLGVGELPRAEFWEAHCSGFAPKKEVIEKCRRIIHERPLVKLVVKGDLDRMTCERLLKACGDLEFHETAFSFLAETWGGLDIHSLAEDWGVELKHIIYLQGDARVLDDILSRKA